MPDVPHVTVIRPVEGLDVLLYDCLASTFQQDYPASRLTVHFCIASRSGPAFPILERLLQKFPDRDARILVEDEDPVLTGEAPLGFRFGPNPKIRNMSRGYREAKGDLVWIIDCNVWVGHGACGRMVDKLCGFAANGEGKPYKFVHHLPIVVDVGSDSIEGERARLLHGHSEHSMESLDKEGNYGVQLEELFLSSSHAKFYTAINTVAIAPCIVGKSNMFRRSHLDYLTDPSPSTGPLLGSCAATNNTVNLNSRTPIGAGIDHFSSNICEDHLIGDLLWRSTLPISLISSASPPSNTNIIPNIGNHGLITTDLAIQPLSEMSLGAYVRRRSRWLRVRKFTVTLATFVEPGTESFLCSAYGAFAISTLSIFQSFHGTWSKWTVFTAFWILSIVIWVVVDWSVYRLLHAGWTVERTNDTPEFARGRDYGSRYHDNGSIDRRLPVKTFWQWLSAWLGREALALPIWFWAFWGGTTVTWRGRQFWVGSDMRVHEIKDNAARRRRDENGSAIDGRHANGVANDARGKWRRD